MSTFRRTLMCSIAVTVFAFSSSSTHAGAIQLTSASQLNPADATLTYPGTNLTVLPSPLNLSIAGNTLTFTKIGTGSFVVSLNGLFGTSFPPNTAVLYTGNANGQGSGNIEISFAT